MLYDLFIILLELILYIHIQGQFSQMIGGKVKHANAKDEIQFFNSDWSDTGYLKVRKLLQVTPQGPSIFTKDW